MKIFAAIFILFAAGLFNSAEARPISSKDFKATFGFTLPESTKLVAAIAYDNMFAGTYYLIAVMSYEDFKAIVKSQDMAHDEKLLSDWPGALEGPEKDGWKISKINDDKTVSSMENKDGNLRVARYENGMMFFKLDVP